jgi:phage-related protein
MTAGVRLRVVFFKTATGREPVREWIKALPREDQKVIGSDILTVQYGWPLGMPLVRKLEEDLWEVRSMLDTRIARVLFTVQGTVMVLLHGFIKKAQKTPKHDLALARQRLRQLREGA